MSRALVIGDLIGLPYLDGGRDSNGIDCVGLVYLYHQDILHQELPEYDIATMTKTWRHDRLEFWGDIATHFSLHKRPEKNGDILILQIPGNDRPHFGVWLADGDYFIHTHKGVNVALAHYKGPWLRWTITVLRPKAEA